MGSQATQGNYFSDPQIIILSLGVLIYPPIIMSHAKQELIPNADVVFKINPFTLVCMSKDVACFFINIKVQFYCSRTWR